ncbi:MAG TPA: ATP-grasp domain-containing protein [Actinospica sp.]|jgi:hypothetical protein|nr:ATP-grasp domain-containing protein [Actinospica sp.]
MTRHVLLLNSDKPQVLRALAKRDDLRIRVITRPVYAALYPESAGFDTAFVDSFEDLGQIERAAYELARRGPIEHVLAPTEKSVVAAGWIRTLLGVRPGPTVEQSLYAAHKWVMKRRLRECGLPVTDFAQAGSIDVIAEAAESVGWPVIVKPVFGSGAKCTHRLDSAAHLAAATAAGELDALAARGLPIQVERLVRLRGEYHCDGIVRDGEIRRAAVARYFVPPLATDHTYVGSHFVDQHGPFARRVLELHARVVEALGLVDGVTHLEVFETAEGPLIGEVAIRPGGIGIARSWHHAFGIDMWDEFVAAALGEPYRAPAKPAEAPGVRGWLQLVADPGLAERIRTMPNIVEVLDPSPSAPGHLEVHFTAPGEDALTEFAEQLRDPVTADR